MVFVPRRPVRRAAVAAGAFGLLALVPAASASEEIPPGVNVNIPPLIRLSVPSTSPGLQSPGITVSLPGIATVAVPLDLDGPGLPVTAAKVHVALVDLPPTISVSLPKLLSVEGLGPTLSSVSPGLEVHGGSTNVNAALDEEAYTPEGQINIYGDVDD